MATPQDIPQTLQQTFIIYSKLDRDGSHNVIIPSVPGVWQTAAFTCATGFKAVSGSYSSAVVDITPSLNDGLLSFEVMGKAQGAYHSGYFVLTLTTNGETEMSEETEEEIVKIASVTLDFTVRVVVYGKADVLAHNRAHTYYAGEYIEPFSVVPPTVNPIIDYGGTSGSLKDTTQQYDSGLYLTHIQDPIQFKTVDIKLGGTATRPGVYLAWIYANQWTEGGQYDNLPSTFDRGNNAAPLMITILDHDHAEGNLMVNATATVTAASCYRVVWLSETVKAVASAEYLYNCEMYKSSDTLWHGQYEDDKGYYTLLYQYRLRDEGGAWVLEGREIDSRSEDPPPDFEVYDTSDYRIEMQENPHVYGWSNVIIQGLTDFYMKARDIRGMDEQEAAEVPYQDYGFFNKIADGVWEQQIQYTPQYEGLTTAAERQFAAGKIYSELEELEGDFFEWDVQKIAIAQTVSPYAPPATEYYGSTPVRDVALTAGGTMHSLNGEKEDGVVVPAGKRWKYWPGARRIVPLNGSSGDWTSLPNIVVTYESETRSNGRRREDYSNQALSGDVVHVEEDTISSTETHFSGALPGNGQSRLGNLIQLAVGASDDGNGTYNGISSWKRSETFTNSFGTVVTYREITDTADGVVYDAFGGYGIYLASGPFSGLCKHQALSAEMASFSASGTAITNRHEVVNDVVTDTPGTVAFGAKASFVSDRVVVVDGTVLSVTYGQEKITEAANGSYSYGYTTADDSYSETGGGTFSATSNRTSINGENDGTTTVIYTPNGGTAEEVVSPDPDGTVYQQALEDYASGINIPPPSWTGPPSELMTEVIITWNESYSREAFVFTP